MSDRKYSVSVVRTTPRSIAAVRAEMPIGDVPRKFGALLGQVYSVAQTNGIVLDGQNIFVYRPLAGGDVDVEFGVGVTNRFPGIGAVSYSETPVGEAATATHWGDYAGLRGAHEAVATWCREHGRRGAGSVWEVYGHWTDDPASLRTDVYHLLEPGGAGR